MGTDENENPGAVTGDTGEGAETAAADGSPAAEENPTGEHSEQWLANARQAGEKIKAIFKS
jgi:hypothetical protein